MKTAEEIFEQQNPQDGKCPEWAIKLANEFAAQSQWVKVSEVINYIENESDIPIPIESFFNENGSHITKKQYGIVLLKVLCEELRSKFLPLPTPPQD